MKQNDQPAQRDLPGFAVTEACDLKLDKLRADLARIRREVEQLQALADEAGLPPRRRFARYLDLLDRKQVDIKDAIDGAERPDGLIVRSIERAIKEAWQRLAIAKAAAEARFN